MEFKSFHNINSSSQLIQFSNHNRMAILIVLNDILLAQTRKLILKKTFDTIAFFHNELFTAVLDQKHEADKRN